MKFLEEEEQTSGKTNKEKYKEEFESSLSDKEETYYVNEFAETKNAISTAFNFWRTYTYNTKYPEWLTRISHMMNVLENYYKIYQTAKKTFRRNTIHKKICKVCKTGELDTNKEDFIDTHSRTCAKRKSIL